MQQWLKKKRELVSNLTMCLKSQHWACRIYSNQQQWRRSFLFSQISSVKSYLNTWVKITHMNTQIREITHVFSCDVWSHAVNTEVYKQLQCSLRTDSSYRPMIITVTFYFVFFTAVLQNYHDATTTCCHPNPLPFKLNVSLINSICINMLRSCSSFSWAVPARSSLHLPKQKWTAVILKSNREEELFPTGPNFHEGILTSTESNLKL